MHVRNTHSARHQEPGVHSDVVYFQNSTLLPAARKKREREMEKKINTLLTSQRWLGTSRSGAIQSRGWPLHTQSLPLLLYLSSHAKDNNGNHSPVEVQANQYLNKLTKKTNSPSKRSVLIDNNSKLKILNSGANTKSHFQSNNKPVVILDAILWKTQTCLKMF